MNSLGATSIAAYEGGAQKVLSPLALATSMAANVAIMVALSYLLHRSRSGLKSTNHLINVLMFYTIQAGALIIVVDIAVIILNQYFSRTGLVYIAVYSMLGNLYANSVLASLNARASLRDNHRSDGIISASGPIVWRSDVSTFETTRGGTQTVSDTVGGSTPALTSEAYQLHLLASAGRRSESKGHDTKVTVLDTLKGDADSV
ncbi:hypothetical protein BC629DRAFT_1095055 [Irpex lacteus]|nr:hypothetical protein BC629DRAFT_1095055 [Irpex lacteus]